MSIFIFFSVIWKCIKEAGTFKNDLEERTPFKLYMKIGTLEEAFCVEKPYEQQQISKEGIQKAFSKLFGVKHRVQ